MKNRPSWALPVLLAGQDVRRMLDEEAGHRVHDPRLVRAGQRENVFPAPRSVHNPPKMVAYNATNFSIRNNSAPHDRLRSNWAGIDACSRGALGRHPTG